MENITQRQVLNFTIGLFSLVILFHLAIVTQVIPYEIVWAGKLNTVEEMYAFEAVSISINIFLMIVLLLKANYIKHTFTARTLNIILWIFIALFLLNTIGNLMAKTDLEKYLFTPLTMLSALLLWMIIRKDK